jgi:hypothetical protein
MTSMLSILFLLGAGDDFAAAVRAYRDGRFRDALHAFVEAERSAGPDAPPELLYDQALAALRAGELGLAESAAERAAARGGAEFLALRDFVLGSAAFARAEKAELEASRPEAEPFAFNPAITQAEAARIAWQRAAMSKPDWPEARRNVERALLKVEELKRKKAAAEQERQKQKGANPPSNPSRPDARPEPQPETPAPREAPAPDEQTQDQRQQVKPTDRPEPAPDETSPEPVARLLEKLREKEREKLALRRGQRKARNARVEKDW